MKHLLIFFLATCCSHASAEKAIFNSDSQPFDSQTPSNHTNLYCPQVHLATTSNCKLSSVSTTCVKISKSTYLTNLGLILGISNYSQEGRVSMFISDEISDKRIFPSDYMNNVLFKQTEDNNNNIHINKDNFNGSYVSLYRVLDSLLKPFFVKPRTEKIL